MMARYEGFEENKHKKNAGAKPKAEADKSTKTGRFSLMVEKDLAPYMARMKWIHQAPIASLLNAFILQMREQDIAKGLYDPAENETTEQQEALTKLTESHRKYL